MTRALDFLDALFVRAWTVVLRALDRMVLGSVEVPYRAHPWLVAARHAWARAMGPWRRFRYWWDRDPIAERKARERAAVAVEYAAWLREITADDLRPPAVTRYVYAEPLAVRPVRVPVPDVQLTPAQHATIAARVATVLDAICSSRLDEADAWSRALAVVPDPCEPTPEYDALVYGRRPVQLTLEGIAA